MEFLMKCGHVANARDDNENPICIICYGVKNGYNEIKAVCNGTEGLEGRQAVCFQHKGTKKIISSSWDLPLFEYRPDEKYDTYYCGCCGWD